MTQFEKIKEQIAAASVEELAEILIDTGALFGCDKCEKREGRWPEDCDFECVKHCLIWLNSPVPDE